MTNTETKNYANQRAAIINREKLSLKAEFVPFSQSRNAKEKNKSLNWKVTLLKDNREICTTDYMQGIGHAPSYKNPPRRDDSDKKVDNHCWQLMQASEAETGRKANLLSWRTGSLTNKERIPPPKLEDILYSLLSDAGVLNHPTYEGWAGSLGYDPDSRKGESVYRACLEIALKLRNGLGESLISELQEAFQDY